eukprot:2451064-Prymnesium_polylepis.1
MQQPVTRQTLVCPTLARPVLCISTDIFRYALSVRSSEALTFMWRVEGVGTTKWQNACGGSTRTSVKRISHERAPKTDSSGCWRSAGRRSRLGLSAPWRSSSA